MKQGSKVFKLVGKVQHYDWGGTTFIPDLLSLPNPEKRPFAEYWMGAHEGGPSSIGSAGNGAHGFLNEFIRERPEETLGAYTAGRFGRLPYLFKILDVKEMLSIQVHPTKKNAEQEFATENQRGVDIKSPTRNYKDDNHKPELMLALSDFWLLHGFKPAEELLTTLQSVPELSFLIPVFGEQDYRSLYKTVMEMPDNEVDKRLQPLMDRIIPLYKDRKISKKEEHFWAARAALTYNRPGHTDRGIFSIYLFNLLNLHKGEAIFQDAGLPHAYLEGQNVEIMANSDNVLRGGLTPKHVDVPELLKHVRFEATYPRITPEDSNAGHISVFRTPAPDFELSKISLLPGECITIRAHSIEIFIVLEGHLGVEEDQGEAFTRKRGEAFLGLFQSRFNLVGISDTVLYRASVPSGAL
jgi:mannose-6-phosphate isomerase